MYPRLPRPGRIAAAAAALLAALAAGCGGGGEGAREEPPPTLVRGPGFRFLAPAGWKTSVSRRGAAAREDGEALVSVTVFPLLRPYRPALWKAVRGELDRVADRLAARLAGRVQARATVQVAGLPGRRYDLSYPGEGGRLRQRIVFLLRGRSEYQLLCRWREGAGRPAACDLLAESFRPL